jgi:hypothetical protein
MKHLTIRPLESRDVAPISAAFSGLGWNKPRSQYERYLSEQQRGTRKVFDGSPVRPGDEITVNDGLVLYLTKTLAEEPSPKSSSPCAW